jgi:hypothetical protein
MLAPPYQSADMPRLMEALCLALYSEKNLMILLVQVQVPQGITVSVLCRIETQTSDTQFTSFAGNWLRNYN